ncbi:GEVED domain-containing protein [Pirellulaceae bacterium SH501]
MTTVGTGSGSFSSNHPRKDRSKKRKQLLVRRSLLESLESRQLMAVGPQLIGVQPNEGELISLTAGNSGATVLSSSPREIVLRFDDSSGIDPSTLSGIQVKRAGTDGILSSAYLSTDLGTNGRVVLDFSASLPGQQGNGLELVFTQTQRSSGIGGKPASWPVLSVSGNRINIQVNTQAGFKTTASDLIRAMTEDATVASKVLVKRLRGSESEIISDFVPAGQVLTLDGADSARVSSNLNSGTNTLQVEFLSVLPSSSGGGTQVQVVSRDFGGEAAPVVTVTGNVVRVEVNSNSRFATTVSELINAINSSTDASQVVRARLVSGSPSTRIGANSTTYSPLTLIGGDDVAIQPSFIGFGETDREIVIRFAESLPDDFYLIDILGSGPFALRSTNGLPFNGGVSRSVRFDLDLGPTVQSVVPQPVIRNSNGSLSQLRNVVHVFFNGDDLNPVEAVKPEYYQLVYTNNTVSGTDDFVYLPVSVNYDAILNRSTLTFERNLDALVHPTTGAVLPITALRLRIGNNEVPASGGVTQVNPAVDPGSRFDTATDLGGGWAAGGGSKAVIIDSEIRNTNPFPLDFPGANNEAGNRNNRYQQHVTRIDQDGIAVIPYNFASALGTANSSVQLNAITEPQKDLVRQIFSLYEKYLGVRFLESDSLGFTVAVGDMLAINPLTALTPIEANAAGGLTYAAGPLASNAAISAVVIDIQDFNTADDTLFGTELFRSFMRGIGVLLGLGNADELPQSTVQNNSPLNPAVAEAVFPGNHDIVHGQNILRPEGKDIDLYRFTLPSQGGQINLEIAAERQGDSSLLDASLRLYRNEGTAAAPRWVEVAANEDYFSKDPRISLDFVQGGEYIIGVSAKGNTTYDPSIEDSGLGGKSEGKYQLRIDYRPPAPASLVDSNGAATPLDGDGDGRPGGVFNYWFVPTRPDRATVSPGVPDVSAYTIWVDKAAVTGGNGTLAAPYNTIAAALASADAMSRANPNGERNIVVRILGNAQNRAYEIGFNRFGAALADGATFDVPKNVTVMIDAGAIIKVGRARISAGSSTVSVDRSGGALQLLGTPDSKVIVTSINDTIGVGVNPDRTPPAPTPGDWGGIDFRNRIDGSDETRTDRERNGLFLNTVVHSDIRFGGGQVLVDGVSQVITPIHIVDSRPTVANNLITRSADAAMSATPNSFREDNFLDPRSQSTGFFVSDYDRVGPDIHGNRVVNNTLNGLFVRTRTGVAENPETITVSARFDDIDIPHVIGENLVVDGRPGGGILDVAAPPVSIVTLASAGAGSLAAGTYNYRLVYVDQAGNESLASVPTSSLTVAANGSIQLNNLPPISTDLPYVARRIYRSDATGAGTYSFVAQINAVSTSFVDTGAVTGAPLADLAIKVRSRLDGSLVVDGGTIIKAQGARIEIRNGGNLMAEGTQGLPVIITSVNDSRFGIGGTSDTTGSQTNLDPQAGDWGGVFVGHASSASLDNVRIAYAGGTTRIEGGFASFNPIEVHQADFRMANSRIELSLDGTESATTSNRTGRGTNAPAAIFVRGSQPILVNNRIADNEGAAISIDVNSLNSDLINDPGRMTGGIGAKSDYVENQGPLVRGNRLSRNSINGMQVRGQTLTTQSVWDDTDMVHVVSTTITSDNLHTYGGLRLKSSATESLVVKFGGENALAGLDATGTPLDYSNRIGGSIQIVGQPNFPVVMTALADDSVGAGFGLDGRPNFDTDNNGTAGSSESVVRLPTGPEVDNGIRIDNDVNINTPGYFSATPEVGGNISFFGTSGITAQGTSQLFVDANVIFDFINYIDLGSNGGGFELANTTITQQPTLVAPDLVVSAGTFTGNNNAIVRWRIETRFDNGISKMFNTLILDSDQALGDISFVNYLDEDIQSPSDDFLYVAGTPGQADFRAYTIDSAERIGFSHGGVYQTGTDLQNATYLGWAADQYRDLANAIETNGTTYSLAGNINTANLPPINDPLLGQVYGLSDVTTAFSWRVEPNATTARMTSFLELVPTAIQRQATPGSWSGVSMQTYSNDRNVSVVTEKESARASAPSSNDQPTSAQYVGQLARQISGGDENARLGFEIQGSINKPSDVDVYSFTANGRTEVWFDIDRTTLGLDTVVELIAADGTILALSDDSYLEETQPGTNPIFSSLSGNSANPLRKSPLSQVARTAAGEARDDYSTNLKDAGFRVVLPGQENVASLYHVRVRSSNQFPGQPAGTPALSDPASVGQGRSRGSYQMQIRLGEAQEYPGSSVSHADIRYATTGITLSGVPRHSPLVGETAEVENATTNNNTFATAQYLGNILQTDRSTISVAGSLTSNTDIDWYSFDIDYQQLVSPLAEYLSTIFDIDYADGIGRADMSMYLFNAGGNLIHVGEDSNILDDRATSLRSADNTDLGRGSTGTLDPYLGSVELPAGRYFLAVTSRTQVPTVIANRLNRNAAADDSGVRIQPINGGQYIVEDRVDNRRGNAAQGPIVPQFLPESSRVEYMLGDVPLYLLQEVSNGSSQLYLANSFTGELSNSVGTAAGDIRDLAIRPNGDIRGFRGAIGNVRNDASADYMLIDPGTGAAVANGNFGVVTRQLDATGQLADQNVGLTFQAVTFASINNFGGNPQEAGFVVANRAPGNGVPSTRNILYRFNPNTGAGDSTPANVNSFNIVTAGNPDPPDIILGAGTSVTERGFIQTSNPAAVSTSVAVTEATQVRAANTTSLISDGDTITLRALPNTNIVFEFNAGPELTLQFDPINNPTRVLLDGDQFLIDGVTYRITTNPVPPVIPGVRSVFYQPTMNNEQFVASLRQSIAPGIQIGFDGTRVNFSGALTGSFGTLVSRGVARDLGSTGNVGSGRVAVNFLAEDTAATIAVRLVQAVNSAGFAGLSAVANGNIVQFVNANVIGTTGSSRAIGIPPGGDITGIAQVGNALFAVSNQGGLYRIPQFALESNSPGNIATYVTSSYNLTGIQFTGLTAGPRNAGGGQYEDILFGTDAAGNIYAFDTDGNFVNVFANGTSRVSTGISNLSGLAFSNLDYNLWHVSSNRSTDPGHGLNAPTDRSDIASTGGQSWYFGFENANANNNVSFNSFNNPLAQPRALGTPLANTYNFPGGAAGVLESQAFSLTGMSSGDKPTLYFNYFLSTEDTTSSLNNPMRDSFRVYAAGDDGQWRLMVTNNDNTLESPIERAIDNNLAVGAAPAVAWRQARVDLSSLAGNKDVRLRFEFSTAGGMGYGYSGGRDFEMKVVAGRELSDGQTFNIGGRQFEIEMGSRLVVPSGSGIRNLETFTVLGTTFTFWDGTGTSPAGDVITYSVTDTPNQLAVKIHDALRAASYDRPVSTVNFADPAGGSDTLIRALSVGVNGGLQQVRGIGAIGDNINLDPAFDRDIDLVRMTLEAGSEVVITASATTLGSPLDPYVRIFDSLGQQLAFNNDFAGTRDSRIVFTVPQNGVYYIGVSGSANTNYNPNVAGSGTNGGSQGQYELVIDVTPRQNISVLDNRVQLDGVRDVILAPNSSLSLLGGNGLNDGTAVPVYISQNMTAEQVATEVKRAMEEALVGVDGFDTFAQRGVFLDMTGVQISSTGPFTLTSARPEDALSEWGTNNFGGNNNPFNRPAFRAQNNAFEGVYLDDFIIGVAERGEQVTGTRSDTSFVTVGSNTGPQGGTYQLEIRGGTDYGSPRTITNPRSNIELDLVRSFAPNAPQSASQSITFNAASSIADGQTIRLSDGVNALVLEFDDESLPATSPARGVTPGNIRVPYNPFIGESSQIIASRIRDLINSTVVQSVLKIGAISADGATTGTNSDTIFLIGTIDATVPTNIGQYRSTTFQGDRNTPREQGQIVIENSKVSFSNGFGIALEAGDRDPNSNAPNPGSVRNTITLNNARLAPGAVIVNNELVGNFGGGIRVEGDSVQGDVPAASVPFARIVNNTILGGTVTPVSTPAPSIIADDFYSLGSVAFADAVVSYTPAAGGGPVPIAGLQVPADALGLPNYAGIGEPVAGQGVVSLGRGGSMVLQFTNNILTGSNDARPDLVVYEVGQSENVRVEVSSDGVTYRSVGVASFNNRYIDLDAFGYNSLSQLQFVRLTDELNQGSLSGDSVGADIDAVGALSSRPGLLYQPSGVGISIGPNASPTLLNNIVVNHSTGIAVDPTSNSAVVGGTLYQHNTQNTTGIAGNGQFPIVVSPNVPLFSNAANGNLYPVPGSQAIDASIDSLADRAALLSVKQPLGLLPSPIITPATDITGQLRVDDPNVAAPPGLGESVFKDRGASDRSDFSGPIAIAINPVDNDALGTDRNSSVGTVEIVGKTFSYFDIQLVDTSLVSNTSQGTGIDRSTVSSSSILVYKNGQILIEGLDYRFGYDTMSNIIRLTPLAGLWESESVYQIRFINTNESMIQLAEPAATVDGTTYTILDNRNVSTYFELDTGIRLTVPQTGNGITHTVADGTTFRIDDGFRLVTFEFDNDSVVTPGNIAVAFDTQDSPTIVAEKIVSAVRGTLLNLSIQSIGAGQLQILGSNLIRVQTDTSLMTQSGATGVLPTYGFRVPSQDGQPTGFLDGQTFSVQRGNTILTFEFDSNGILGTPTNIAVPLAGTVDAISASVVSALNSAGLGLTATFTSGGFIAVGDQADLRLLAPNGGLQVVGAPGRAGNVPVVINLLTVQSASQVAELLIQAIEAQNLPGIDATALNNRVFIEGALGVAGLNIESVSGIRDIAGNPMRATEPDGSTITTIFLGEGLDYGDAPDPIYATKKINNGPRHTVVEGFSLGTNLTADADARIDDLDDGVTLVSATAAYAGSIIVNVQGITASRVGYVNAWIDYNGNGTFEASEKLSTGGRFANGNNTVTFNVPNTAVTDRDVAMRVRFSSTEILEPVGPASDGEVEDYMIRIGRNPYQNPTNALDVNADGFVSAIDVLNIVNFINNTGGGRLPPGNPVPPYLDVNGDGFASPIDVLTVINFINAQSAGGEGEGEGGVGAPADMWVAATAMPTVDTNRSDSVAEAPIMTGDYVNVGLDEFLAMLPTDVGPQMALEDFDWSSVAPVVSNDESEDGFGQLLDEVLDELV